ncbi:hypothetical protein PPYR_15586 [Photinus pyralis]|uniref:Uncharacterized protein n=1 Tax=Photinus pyralis TaxID=7054 RepID=A0A5N3ZYF2_PHOPY|nr:hypothetical protein PPYR_15586 [Photinus pyralis]
MITLRFLWRQKKVQRVPLQSTKKKKKITKKMSTVDSDRQREMARERKRRQRERIKADAMMYQREKEKERERYQKRKLEGKLKPISERSKREQRKQRKMWRKNNHTYQAKKKLNKNNTEGLGDAQPSVSIKIKLGRKKVLSTRSKTSNLLLKERHLRKRQEKMTVKWKNKYFYLKNKVKNNEPPTPKKAVEKRLLREEIQEKLRRNYSLAKF